MKLHISFATWRTNYTENSQKKKRFRIIQNSLVSQNLVPENLAPENDNKLTNEIIKTENIPVIVPEIGSSNAYCSVVKKVKKHNINAENIAAIMLSQIPGVSSVSATAICLVYKTIPQLVFALQENPHCLDGFSIMDSTTHKSRKMNKSVIYKIAEYLQITPSPSPSSSPSPSPSPSPSLNNEE